MAKETWCPICKEILGRCKHNRLDMIMTILQAWDKIKMRDTVAKEAYMARGKIDG
jgi:hypothetical protein|tara:strand:- start:254 stop:418 length:165 start_codon:yes stop_codon:yes gene_type:complete